MSDFDPNFLMAVRISRKATPEQVARAAGREPDLYCEYESGETVPTMGSLERLADALGCDVAAFFNPDKPASKAWFTPEEYAQIRAVPTPSWSEDQIDSMAALIARLRLARAEATRG